MPNKIPVAFHNVSDYDYHFIIKELANEFEGNFECLGENTEKLKKFSVPIEKKIQQVDRDGNENIVTISYKIKFIDSARFMTSSLSNLVDNLAEGIHTTECKYWDWIIDNLINCKCLSCNENYSKAWRKLRDEFKKHI